MPKTIADWTNLHKKTPKELQALGMQPWTKKLHLFPHTWYKHIPNKLIIHDIFFQEETFERGKTSDDHRAGYLAFGVLAT